MAARPMATLLITVNTNLFHFARSLRRAAGSVLLGMIGMLGAAGAIGGVGAVGCASPAIPTPANRENMNPLHKSYYYDSGPKDTAGFTQKTLSIAAADGTRMLWVVYHPDPLGSFTERTPQQPTAKTLAPLPLIVFLHGKGECGTDGWKQVSQGLGRAVMQNYSRWPAVILFPQKPDPEKQWEEYTEQVMEGIAKAQAGYRTDPSRVYLTGLSQGGAGTWSISSKSPGTFAAIVPICGYIDPQRIIPQLNKMPAWAFHGGADDIVLPDQSRIAVAALRKAGSTTIEYTEFAGVNHNSWDAAYADPRLPAWLFAQRK